MLIADLMNLKETLKWKKEKKNPSLYPGESTVSLYKVLFFLAMIIIYNLQDMNTSLGMLLKRDIHGNVRVSIKNFLVLFVENPRFY